MCVSSNYFGLLTTAILQDEMYASSQHYVFNSREETKILSMKDSPLRNSFPPVKWKTPKIRHFKIHSKMYLSICLTIQVMEDWVYFCVLVYKNTKNNNNYSISFTESCCTNATSFSFFKEKAPLSKKVGRTPAKLESEDCKIKAHCKLTHTAPVLSRVHIFLQ